MCLSESVLNNILHSQPKQLAQPRVMALFTCELGTVWCVWNLFQSSNTASGVTSSCEGANMCGVGISNCELSRTSASSSRLGSPVACDGFRQHTGFFPPGCPSSRAGSLGTWSWQPGHRIVAQHWGSMPAVTSGMAVPLCRACVRLVGAVFSARTR